MGKTIQYDYYKIKYAYKLFISLFNLLIYIYLKSWNNLFLVHLNWSLFEKKETRLKACIKKLVFSIFSLSKQKT